MENRSSNLLDEALGIEDQTSSSWRFRGRVLLIEDSVETSGSFVLHHLIKRSLSPHNPSSVVIFLGFSRTFSHYDRILRKLGCNLSAQSDNNRFLFFDKFAMHCPDGDEGETSEGVLVQFYLELQQIIANLAVNNKKSVTVMIDDVSQLETAANGNLNYVLDFLHYCHTLTSNFGCSLVALIHEDIYVNMERPRLILQLEYFAEILIKAEPLATGLAADVHGQLTVLNREICDGKEGSKNKIRNFHFRVKENGIDYFYPGSRT